MALKMKKVAPTSGYGTECPCVARNEDGRSVGMDADGEVHDAVAKTPKCKKKRSKAVKLQTSTRCRGLRF